jgi:hypothetical protein
MDTKARKTPVQDTLSGARFSPPDPKLASGTAKSGKKQIRKTEINFKSSPKKILSGFPSVNIGLQLLQQGRASGLRPCQADAQPPSRLAGSDLRVIFGSAQ